MKNLPATQAVRKQVMVPATSALNATFAKSDALVGAKADIPPSWTPIEDMFANPQRAYVAMASERGYKQIKMAIK